MKRALPIVLGAALLLIAGIAAAFLLRPERGDPAAGDRLRVLFTGETLGRLDPCICDGTLAGGLAFRDGFLKRQTDEYLLFDTGNMARGTRHLERLRAASVLRAMARMGYDAANLGEHEIALGVDGVRELHGLGVPLVSANVVTGDGETVVPSHRLVQCGGLAVAVTGVVEDDRFPCGPGLRVRPAREELARLMPRLRERARVLVLLADLELAAVRDLAQDFPELTAILFRGRQDSHKPERVNRTVIASIYGGRYIGDLTLTWKTPRRAVPTTGRAVVLDDRFAGGRTPVQAPEGVEVSPSELAFGAFRQGELHRSRLTVTNHNDKPITLGRVYSPCTCFALEVEEVHIPPGESTSIDVTLHSLELSGENTFSLYVEVQGVTSGILVVPATAMVEPERKAPGRESLERAP